MQRSGLTLVQTLLSLVALFGVAAILFPFFARAREPRGKSSCQSNLKQITLGFKQYVQDYDSKYPPIAVESLANAAKGAPYGWGDVLQPYLKSWGLFQCPYMRDNKRNALKSWQPGLTDYYVNRRIGGALEKHFPREEFTVVLGEGNDGLDRSNSRYAYAAVPPAWLTDNNSPIHRHLDGCNYAFLDGHVKWLQVEKSPGTTPSSQRRFTFAR